MFEQHNWPAASKCYLNCLGPPACTEEVYGSVTEDMIPQLIDNKADCSEETTW